MTIEQNNKMMKVDARNHWIQAKAHLESALSYAEIPSSIYPDDLARFKICRSKILLFLDDMDNDGFFWK